MSSEDTREPNLGHCAPHGWYGLHFDTPCPACLQDPEKKFWIEAPAWVKKAMEVHEKIRRLEQDQADGSAGCHVEGQVERWLELRRKAPPACNCNKGLSRAEGSFEVHERHCAANTLRMPSEEPTAPGGVSGHPWPEDPSEGVRLPNGIDLGTVVSLRGGGPSMTVVGVPVPRFPSDPQLVECAWEEHGGLLFREFPVKALMFRKED